MEQQDGDSPPFWTPPTTVLVRSRRRSSAAPILSPVFLILLVSILLLLVIFFLLLPFLSNTTRVIRPTSVKKSWDSLSIVLVVFAILCGVFARRNDSDVGDQPGSSSSTVSYSSSCNKLHQSVSSQWCEYSDRKAYDPPINSPGIGAGRLRSSSSNPDLRHVSSWETDLDHHLRFFDDFELNMYRSSPSDLSHRRRSETGKDDSYVKEVPVDTSVVRPSSSPAAPPPKSPTPPPPPPTLPTNLNRRRSFQSVAQKQKLENRSDNMEAEFNRSRSPPPPPPPPPSAVTYDRSDEEYERTERKRSGTSKEIATAIASLYSNPRSRKRNKKTRNIYENVTESPPSVHPVVPPPPPPPPPPSVFHNLFRKGSKNKRVHSLASPSIPPPPPPPPPPTSIFNNLFKNGSKSKRFYSSSAPPPPPPPPPPLSSILNKLKSKTGSISKRFHSTSGPPPPPPPPPAPVSSTRSSKRKNYIQPPSPPPPQTPEPLLRRPIIAVKPPLPTRPMSRKFHIGDNANSGAQSPLIPMPPSPPPPPFRMRETKFVARGDFVLLRSGHSSRCSSPELEDVEVISTKSSDTTDCGDPVGSPFCPSPDVNVKADSFIARHRDGWKLEKINSLRERQKLAHPGPGP